MVVFPNAKINIGLRVLNKRTDGYHAIESGLFPLNWKDVLEIIPATGESSFDSSGLEIGGSKKDNLVWKSFLIMRDRYDIPPVNIFLYKNIPMGAGLGGGSSDGAFTIKTINTLFKLNLPNEEMESLAAELGSDCPFFIKNRPSLATGTGTTLSMLDHSLRDKWIVVASPEINISTSFAYSNLSPSATDNSNLKDTLSGAIVNWNKSVINDFESSIFSAHAEISKLKALMYSAGAVYASMSGSGSSVYGIFDAPKSMDLGMPSWSGSICV